MYVYIIKLSKIVNFGKNLKKNPYIVSGVTDDLLGSLYHDDQFFVQTYVLSWYMSDCIGHILQEIISR